MRTGLPPERVEVLRRNLWAYVVDALERQEAEVRRLVAQRMSEADGVRVVMTEVPEYLQGPLAVDEDQVLVGQGGLAWRVEVRTDESGHVPLCLVPLQLLGVTDEELDHLAGVFVDATCGELS